MVVDLLLDHRNHVDLPLVWRHHKFVGGGLGILRRLRHLLVPCQLRPGELSSSELLLGRVRRVRQHYQLLLPFHQLGVGLGNLSSEVGIHLVDDLHPVLDVLQELLEDLGHLLGLAVHGQTLSHLRKLRRAVGDLELGVDFLELRHLLRELSLRLRQLRRVWVRDAGFRVFHRVGASCLLALLRCRHVVEDTDETHDFLDELLLDRQVRPLLVMPLLRRFERLLRVLPRGVPLLVLRSRERRTLGRFLRLLDREPVGALGVKPRAHGCLERIRDLAHRDVGSKLLAAQLLEQFIELLDDDVLLLAQEGVVGQCHGKLVGT
mmetsp:Transcript_9485/g.18939  ORF Transcript_9485/g.18939 Transcript_9485/m.18939 type:complete len:320 (-) Transcript_9485:355-1314(-)